ncbi:hypothetical protein AJ79_10072 [Helicocarpus griseus UAMH5409]|uniref:Uncharacterized protein n=1 Tax=Helicocarpus griseus UAMH5409 TaxID=1447875 RepID=A0A2B7WFM9_9EURO|nr:hypothetical protein AJ79_10072 [Helicocarpus griseus UAMH5409]
MPENDPPLPYSDGGIYIILSNIRLAAQWHWGIFICVSRPWGQVYHATDSNDYWEFEEKLTDGIIGSRTIHAVVELAKVQDEDTIKAMHDALKDVPVERNGDFVQKCGENFTCRVWVKEALDTLRSKGLISFDSVNDLEHEVIATGNATNRIGTRLLLVSKHCSA